MTVKEKTKGWEVARELEMKKATMWATVFTGKKTSSGCHLGNFGPVRSISAGVLAGRQSV